METVKAIKAEVDTKTIEAELDEIKAFLKRFDKEAQEAFLEVFRGIDNYLDILLPGRESPDETEAPQNANVEKLLELVDRWPLSVYVSEFRLKALNALGRLVNDRWPFVDAIEEFLKEGTQHIDENMLREMYLPFAEFDHETQQAVLAILIETTAAEVESRSRLREGALDFEKAIEAFTVKEKFSMLLVYGAGGLEGVNIGEYSRVLDRHVHDEGKRKEILAEIRTLGDDRLTFLCGIVDAGYNA